MCVCVCVCVCVEIQYFLLPLELKANFPLRCQNFSLVTYVRVVQLVFQWRRSFHHWSFFAKSVGQISAKDVVSDIEKSPAFKSFTDIDWLVGLSDECPLHRCGVFMEHQYLYQVRLDKMIGSPSNVIQLNIPTHRWTSMVCDHLPPVPPCLKQEPSRCPSVPSLL